MNDNNPSIMYGYMLSLEYTTHKTTLDFAVLCL